MQIQQMCMVFIRTACRHIAKKNIREIPRKKEYPRISLKCEAANKKIQKSEIKAPASYYLARVFTPLCKMAGTQIRIWQQSDIVNVGSVENMGIRKYSMKTIQIQIWTMIK